MAAFQNYWYVFMVILLLINGSFLALSFMPATPDGSTTMGDVWGGYGTSLNPTPLYDMNDTINIFGIQMDKNQTVDANVLATTTQQTDLDIFSVIGFIVGQAIAMLSLFKEVLFGYFLWIDFLLNPAWGGMVATMGMALKTIFFLFEIFGIISFVNALNPLRR